MKKRDHSFSEWWIFNALLELWGWMHFDMLVVSSYILASSSRWTLAILIIHAVLVAVSSRFGPWLADAITDRWVFRIRFGAEFILSAFAAGWALTHTLEAWQFAVIAAIGAVAAGLSYSSWQAMTFRFKAVAETKGLPEWAMRLTSKQDEKVLISTRLAWIVGLADGLGRSVGLSIVVVIYLVHPGIIREIPALFSATSGIQAVLSVVALVLVDRVAKRIANAEEEAEKLDAAAQSEPKEEQPQEAPTWKSGKQLVLQSPRLQLVIALVTMNMVFGYTFYLLPAYLETMVGRDQLPLQFFAIRALGSFTALAVTWRMLRSKRAMERMENGSIVMIASLFFLDALFESVYPFLQNLAFTWVAYALSWPFAEAAGLQTKAVINQEAGKKGRRRDMTRDVFAYQFYLEQIRYIYFVPVSFVADKFGAREAMIASGVFAMLVTLLLRWIYRKEFRRGSGRSP